MAAEISVKAGSIDELCKVLAQLAVQSGNVQAPYSAAPYRPRPKGNAMENLYWMQERELDLHNRMHAPYIALEKARIDANARYVSGMGRYGQ